MSLLDSARNLRKNQTKEEIILWKNIRNRKLSGYKFRRQHPIANNYVVDFYCHEKNLIIEIDGGIHLQPDVYAADKLREDNIKALGYQIIRFTNQQIHEELESVLAKILKRLEI